MRSQAIGPNGTAQALKFDFGDGKGLVNNGDAAGDLLTGIENITGSKFHDVIIADDGPNNIDRGLDIDTISYKGDTPGVIVDLSKQFTVAANGTFGGATAVAGIGDNAQGDKLANFAGAAAVSDQAHANSSTTRRRMI